MLNAHCASFTQATAEANNLTAVAGAKDTYNRALEQVELLWTANFASVWQKHACRHGGVSKRHPAYQGSLFSKWIMDGEGPQFSLNIAGTWQDELAYITENNQRPLH